MNIILYITLFLIGCMFGSFYTLAVHRIPKRENITHKHSYCPKCNHKLGFLELIPIVSYIYQKGKCKNCKQKIRVRYLVLEVLSGLLFVVFAMALKIDLYYFNWSNAVFYLFTILYLTLIVLIGGIDKENRKIERPVLAYGVIISLIYIIYLYVIEKANLLRYAIYLGTFVVILILDNVTLTKYRKNSYLNGILMLLFIMAVFTGEYITINSIIVATLAMAIYLLIHKIVDKVKNTKDTEKILSKDIRIGYFICISNVIIFLIMTFLLNRTM